LLEFAK